MTHSQLRVCDTTSKNKLTVNGEVEDCVKSDSQPIYRSYASSYVEGMSKVRTMVSAMM